MRDVNRTEKALHTLFDAGILIKAIDSVGEITLGIVFLFDPHLMYRIAMALFGGELSEVPRDTILNFLANEWNGFAGGSSHFLAFVFLAHGLTKIFLVVGLIKEKLWVYPVAAAAFGAFAIYQIYRATFAPSALLTILTIFDILFIMLILHEYQYKKKFPGRDAK